MRRATVLAITMACGGALAATATAAPLAWSPAAPLPGSPPKGTARGGEPSLAFDPSGNGWVYITTPDRRAGSAPGVHLWTSSDHGMTWSQPKDVGAYSGGSDSDVLVLDDHTLVVGDLEVAATAICRSKDNGKTFGDGCDTGATYDQVGPVSDREWLTTRPGHPEIVYDTYDGLGQGFTPQTQVSHDGGTTWQPCGELLEPGSEAAAHYTVTGATENSEVIGRPAVAKDGTIYVPFTLPNQQAEVANSDPTESSMFVAISPPGGCDATSVWHDVTVWSKPGSNFVSLFPNVVVDAAQNVYVSGAGKLAGTDKQQGIYVWSSPNKGKSFLPPVRVNTPDIGAVQLQSLAPGLGAGELLAGFYGSTNAKDSNDLKSEWRYYVAQSFDGGRTWEQTTTTPDISHHGNICNKGIICTDTDNRNLLDFTTVAVDPATGCGYATFAVDPFNPLGATTLTHPAAAVSHQTSGACLVPGGGQSPVAGSGNGSLPPNVTPCTDRIGPSIRFRKGVQPHDRRFRIALYSRDRGCLSGGVGKVKRVRVAVARLTPKGCEFLRKGRLGKPGSCKKYVWLRAKHSGATWSYRSPKVRRGHYRLYEQAIDAAGNKGRIRHTRPFPVK